MGQIFLFRLVPRRDPGEARTLDPLIKSQLLYQLSYQVVWEFPIGIPVEQRNEIIWFPPLKASY